MKTVIIHGRKWNDVDPRAGRLECELWTNGRNTSLHWQGRLTSWTRHFDAHPIEPTPWHPGIRQDRLYAWEWYRAQRAGAEGTRRVIYLQEARREVPLSQPYPLATVLETLGLPPGRLTTSPDQMLALAAVEGFERVIVNGLGVDVEDNLAWQALHQGIHWWLGFLEGLGVRVEVEGPSLFTLGEHAYGYGPSRYGKMRPGQAADPVRAANRRAINRRRVTRA